MSVVEKLHNAIYNANYELAADLIINEKANPLDMYNGKTAIELCFHLQKKSHSQHLNFYQKILDNLLLPQSDRYLIGTGRAKRGDIMTVSHDGSIAILSQREKIDLDSMMSRIIGHDDHRLSDDFREQRLNVEKSRRFF